jgi:hypothetical protein
LSRKLFHPWIVLYLDVDVDTAANRLAARRACNSCGWIGSVPQGASESCPSCAGQQFQVRAEDRPEILASRLRQASSRLLELLHAMQGIRLIRLDASYPPAGVLTNAITQLAELSTDQAAFKSPESA